MSPERPKKKVRVVNEAKLKTQTKRKQDASSKRAAARKTYEDVSQRRKKRVDQKTALDARLKDASNEEKEALKQQIADLDTQIQQDDTEMSNAQNEESRFEVEEKDADMQDVFSEVDEEDGPDPDNPKKSTESIDPADFAAKLMKGLRISDGTKVTDFTQDVQLRNTQAVTCYKSGLGKPAIVVDCEIPEWMIYRIRKDVMHPEKCPNLMRWRRAGKVKDLKTEEKWKVKDISDVLGIAIEVPLGFDGLPEDLVRLIPPLSEIQKKRLKKLGKPIPRQPDVQLLIEWKEGLKAEGEDEVRFTSWESRSGCRTLWKKKDVADAFLVDVATKRERGYRKAGGQHSSEERSMSPIKIPSAGSTPSREGTVNSDGSETSLSNEEEEEEGKEEKKRQKKEQDEKKRKEKKKEEDGPVDDDLAYKTGLKAFEPKFRMLEDIEAGVKLTAAQKGEMIEAFDAYWEKKQAK